MAIFDADFLISLEAGRASAQQRDLELRARNVPLRVPAAAWVEYLSGVKIKRRETAQARLDQDVIFEPFTRECAAVAVRLQAACLEQGAMMGWNDLQIAATAYLYDEPVVSNDKAFDKIPGLGRLGF